MALAAVAALAATAGASYTVQPGDTLSHIAARNSTTVSALLEANGLADPNRIIAGTDLALPGPATDAEQPATEGTHTVATGEHLSGIAARYGTTVSAIVEANDLGDANAIRAGQRIVVPGASGSTESAPTDGPSTASAPAAGPTGSAEVGALLEEIASAHGWNPAMVKAIAWQESGWRNDVVSSADARGIMQVLPSTGEWVSTYLSDRPLDLNDPRDNITAGVLFLDYLHDVTGGDVEMILAGYYQGLRSVADNGRYATTDRYIENVLALRARY